MIWVALTTAAFAVVGTVRLLRALRTGGWRKPIWRTLAEDEYARSDLYLALLCWFGLVLLVFLRSWLLK